MIQVNNINFSYPGSKHQVFSNFSLELEENKIYGLLGKNGTGKSTLLYLISGLLQPKSGNITINGTHAKDRRPELLKEIFVVPEEFDLPKIALNDYVKINKPFYPKFSEEVLQKCLDDFELAGNLKLNALSMGQKKKVFMSFALATGTRLLLMDEPTNGLDIPSKSQFRKVIANYMSDDRILIISTHQVHDIESLLDHVLILSQKKLLFNESVENICQQYSFEYRTAEQMDDSVIYAEPSLQGNAAISKRIDDENETPVNLELLFNAVISGKI